MNQHRHIYQTHLLPGKAREPRLDPQTCIQLWVAETDRHGILQLVNGSDLPVDGRELVGLAQALSYGETVDSVPIESLVEGAHRYLHHLLPVGYWIVQAAKGYYLVATALCPLPADAFVD